jgi:ribosomal protein L11 methyltransferase
VYSLQLTCSGDQVDLLSAELWEAGTAGIREIDNTDGTVCLIAGFQTNEFRATLLTQFTAHQPKWLHEPATDWVHHAQTAWPGRFIGRHFFLCPPWCEEPTPPNRKRLVHNPGLACGTGEHPCTQMAIEALERGVHPGSRTADIGTGSGILSIAALQLGAAAALGVDPDESAIAVALENSRLNSLSPFFAVASADAIATAWADVVIANISGTVLLALWDDLNRITRPGGTLILTGFPASELPAFKPLLNNPETLASQTWRCLVGTKRL